VGKLLYLIFMYFAGLAAKDKGSGLNIDFKLVPAGEFLMGSTKGNKDEQPVHKVWLDSFWISACEITNRQYADFLNQYGKAQDTLNRVMIQEDKWGLKVEGGAWQPQEGYENHPAVCVTWYGAGRFCSYYGYSLPTEAQWEYAARGGTATEYHFGDSELQLGEYAWYQANSRVGGFWTGRRTSHPVGLKKPNQYGLYDMLGNVWEWCSDWHDGEYYEKSPYKNPPGPTGGTYKIFRGGSWYYDATSLRPANRNFHKPFNWLYNVGFRCVKNINGQ
jgi:sulfatase modifying factor 1